MKKILIVLLATMPMLLSAQTDKSSCPHKEGVVIVVSKEGKKSIKDVNYVLCCTDYVLFEINHSSIQKFVKSNNVWHQVTSSGDFKEVTTQIEGNTFYFIISDKKYFGYFLKKEEQ